MLVLYSILAVSIWLNLILLSVTAGDAKANAPPEQKPETRHLDICA